MKKLNFELLKDLYCVFSPSNGEKRMRHFIKKYIKDNIPGAIVEQDIHGNLLVRKGESESYPCLCAHMDQVQHLHPKDFTCVESDDVIFGYSPKTRQQCGLGADDKNGIFIALVCLQEFDVLKCAFFVGEEIGCVGSGHADISFFSDCRFCAQIDRRGNCDMVTRISFGKICSDEFIKDADCGTWGYCESDGLMTDVEALRGNGVLASCINMSCGYYEPHTDHEYTVKEDVQKCYEFVCHLIGHCTNVYAFEGEDWGYGEYTGSDGYTDSWEYEDCYDYCYAQLYYNADLTFDEFELDASGKFGCLSHEDFKEIYESSKNDLI